jgi:hypothetical protein
LNTMMNILPYNGFNVKFKKTMIGYHQNNSSPGVESRLPL